MTTSIKAKLIKSDKQKNENYNIIKNLKKKNPFLHLALALTFFDFFSLEDLFFYFEDFFLPGN